MTGRFIVCVALFASVSALPAAPVPKEAQETLYFPIKVGTKLVYEVISGASVGDSTFTVQKVEAKGKAFRVTMGYGEKSTALTEVSADGLTHLGNDSQDFDLPIVLLKLPAKPGDTWKRKASDGSSATTYTVIKVEEIEVPAGRFAAVRVDAKPDDEKLAGHSAWYAPKVGRIKWSMQSNGTTTSITLKSYTLGK